MRFFIQLFAPDNERDWIVGKVKAISDLSTIPGKGKSIL